LVLHRTPVLRPALVLIGAIVMGVYNGNHKSQTIYGSEKADSIFARAGNDVVYARGGNDQVYGGYGDDVVYGGSGDDKLYGDEGNGSGNDILYGETGNDTLVGDGGNDRLDGGDGNDFLNGSLDDDILIGGAGSDSFFFYANPGNDSILDFQTGIDILDLRFFGITADYISVTASGSDSIVWVDADMDGTFDFHITLVGTSAPTAADFWI